jgi:hypothetical protein
LRPFTVKTRTFASFPTSGGAPGRRRSTRSERGRSLPVTLRGSSNAIGALLLTAPSLLAARARVRLSGHVRALELFTVRPRASGDPVLDSRFRGNERRLTAAVASRRRDSYSPPPRSERGAARLAHLSGGQGVASSNLAAPTSSPKLKIAKASKKGCPSGGLLFHARITLLSRPKAGRELFRTGEVKNPAEGSSHANGSSSLLPRSLP